MTTMFTNTLEVLKSVSRSWYTPLLLLSAVVLRFSIPSYFYTMVFGIGHSTFTSADDTVPLNIKSQEADNGPPKLRKQVSLLQLCKETVPPCRLNPFLFNGHLQTMWTALKGEDVPIHYKRRIFKSDHAPYPGQFAVDFVIPPPAVPRGRDRNLPPRTHNFSEDEFELFEGSDEKSPLLIVLH